MDVTNGLLSALVQTKSIQQILAPIAAQVSQLIIINEAYESGESSAFSSDVLQSAENVARATEDLVNVACRLSLTSDDQELKSQMPNACDLLSFSGNNLVMSTQRVMMEPHRKEVRRNVVRRAKDVLEGTMKVLLVTDESEVRKIVRTAHFLIDRVTLMESVKSMQTLVPCFKGFTEALILLTKLVDKRQRELTHPRQRERLLTSSTLLKKSVPMLNTSLQTYVKYLSNTQAQASRDYVIKEIISVTNDIIDAVENKYVDDEEYEDSEQIGYFVAKIDELLDMLSADRRFDLSNEFEESWETVVRHSMSVAHLADEGPRSLIVRNCQRILKKKKSLLDQLQNVAANPTFVGLRDDYEDCCDELVVEFQDLESHVNTAVIEMYVDTFKETTEPLERLMKTALSPTKHKTPLKEDKCLQILQASIDNFNSHADRLCQVGWFIAASSTECRRVRSIKTCVKRLEKLDPEIVPATIACRKDVLDKGAVEHLRLLRQEWTAELNALVSTIDQVLDSRHFIELSENLLRNNVELCKDSLYLREPSQLVDVTRAVIGLTRRIELVAKQLLENSDDPIFRNGLLVYVTQLGKAISGVKSAAHQVSQPGSDQQTHQALHKRCDVLLKCVAKVLQGLDSENHPDLLDPLRNGLRPLNGLKGLDLSDEEVTQAPVLEKEITQSKFLSFDIMERKTGLNDDKGSLNLNAGKQSVNSKMSITEDVCSNDLVVLARDLVRAATGMENNKVNLLCNDVMSRSNNLVEVSNNLIVCSPDQSIREKLRDAVSEITAITPQLVTKAKQAAKNDIDALEPLHKLAEEWANKVKMLESTVTHTTQPWSDIGKKLTDVAKMANTKLLTDQIRCLTSHQQMAVKLVSMTSGTDQGSALNDENIQRLNEFLADVENLTMTLATTADILSKTGNEDDSSQLDVASKDWACKLYCLTSTVRQTCDQAGQNYRGCQTEFHGELSDFIRETGTLKDMASSAALYYCGSEKIHQVDPLLSDLDLALNEMAKYASDKKLAGILEGSIENIYSPYKQAVIQFGWIKKAQQLVRLLDDVTSSLSDPFYKIAYAAFSLHSASSTSRKGCMADFDRLINRLNGRFNKVKDLTLRSIQVSDDIERKSVVRRCLDQMGDVTPSVVEMARNLTENASDENMLRFNQLRRQWVNSACKLLAYVKEMPEVNSSEIEDAMLPGTNESLQNTSEHSTHRDDNQTPATASMSTNGKQTASATTQLSSPLTPEKSTQTEDGILGSSASSVTKLHFNDVVPSPVVASATAANKHPNIMYDKRNALHATDPSHSKSGPQSVSYQSFSPASAISPPPTLRRQITSFSGTTQGAQVLPPQPRQAISFSETPRRVQVLPPRPPSSLSKLNQSSRAISVAARYLQNETEKWEDTNNPIVKTAKEMSKQMQSMADFAQLKENLSGKPEFINTAKAIAKNGENIVKFAKIIVEYCFDKRFAKDLMFYADHIPTISTQLNIISSVKAATPEDRSADKVLVKNAENLMKAVSNTLKAAEAACVKGLRQPPEDAVDEVQAVILATQWRRKLINFRRNESSFADTDDLGLRKIRRQSSGPQLSEILLRR